MCCCYDWSCLPRTAHSRCGSGNGWSDAGTLVVSAEQPAIEPSNSDSFVELTGTMLVGCMPTFFRFYEHLRTATGLRTILSTGSQFTRENGGSRVTNTVGLSNGGGVRSRNEDQKRPEYIQLGESSSEVRLHEAHR
jgi:hypothetical protein